MNLVGFLLLVVWILLFCVRLVLRPWFKYLCCCLCLLAWLAVVWWLVCACGRLFGGCDCVVG